MMTTLNSEEYKLLLDILEEILQMDKESILEVSACNYDWQIKELQRLRKRIEHLKKMIKMLKKNKGLE